MAGDLVLTRHSVELVVEAQLEKGHGRKTSVFGIIGAHLPPIPSHIKEKDTHLLSFFNSANAADDDFITPFKCHHLSNTVRDTRVVDVSGKEIHFTSHNIQCITTK